MESEIIFFLVMLGNLGLHTIFSSIKKDLTWI
jgi:hypothetical protein